MEDLWLGYSITLATSVPRTPFALCASSVRKLCLLPSTTLGACSESVVGGHM